MRKWNAWKWKHFLSANFVINSKHLVLPKNFVCFNQNDGKTTLCTYPVQKQCTITLCCSFKWSIMQLQTNACFNLTCDMVLVCYYHSYRRRAHCHLIGQPHLTHSYLLNKDPAPTCEHCKCILTIEHILRTCTKYEHNRKQYFPKSRLSHILLHSPKHNILNYLTDINLLLNYKF